MGIHELLIMKNIPCFLGSHRFTCFPHGGESSVVDYFMTSLDIIPFGAPFLGNLWFIFNPSFLVSSFQIPILISHFYFQPMSQGFSNFKVEVRNSKKLKKTLTFIKVCQNLYMWFSIITLNHQSQGYGTVRQMTPFLF